MTPPLPLAARFTAAMRAPDRVPDVIFAAFVASVVAELARPLLPASNVPRRVMLSVPVEMFEAFVASVEQLGEELDRLPHAG